MALPANNAMVLMGQYYDEDNEVYVQLPISVDANGIVQFNTAAVAVADVTGLQDELDDLQADIDTKIGDDVTLTTTAPLTGGGDLADGLTIAMPAAESGVDGYLTGVDWDTFTAKQDALVDSGDVPGLTAELTAKQDQADGLDLLALMPTPVTKGTIAVWDGDSWAVLTPGANTHILTANDATATGLEWVAP